MNEMFKKQGKEGGARHRFTATNPTGKYNLGGSTTESKNLGIM